MQPRDIDALVAIERASFPNPWHAVDFRCVIHSSNAETLCAVHDRTPGGYAVAFCRGRSLYLANLAVRPDLRRAGIGRQLLNSLLHRAGLLQMEDARLEVRCSNAPAIGLYRSAGFGNAGVRKAYYTNPVEDGLLMRRPLELGTHRPWPEAD